MAVSNGVGVTCRGALGLRSSLPETKRNLPSLCLSNFVSPGGASDVFCSLPQLSVFKMLASVSATLILCPLEVTAHSVTPGAQMPGGQGAAALGQLLGCLTAGLLSPPKVQRLCVQGGHRRSLQMGCVMASPPPLPVGPKVTKARSPSGSVLKPAQGPDFHAAQVLERHARLPTFIFAK